MAVSPCGLCKVFHLLQRYITQHESILDCCKWKHRQSLDFFGLKTLSYMNMWMAVWQRERAPDGYGFANKRDKPEKGCTGGSTVGPWLTESRQPPSVLSLATDLETGKADTGTPSYELPMFSPALGRVVRSTCAISGTSVCTASRPATVNSIGAASQALSRRSHQRRHSSSKASIPPDGSNGSSSPQQTPNTASTRSPEKKPAGRGGRKRATPSLNVPHVPPTDYLQQLGSSVQK